MAIVYFYGEDEKHYTEIGRNKIKASYKLNESQFKVSFKEEEIEKIILESLSDSKDIYILTPIYFNKIITQYSSFIRVIRLENQNGILTSQDMKLGVSAEEKLKSKLNSSITKPKVTFANYGGAKDLIEDTEAINNYFKLGIPVKGIFLAGIPGTGKSFFAKCLAGQLNRYLIELNLTKFMKSENSIILIEEFFDFFKTNPGDYIIWLDEIEKMFTGTDEATQLLGTLLTRINEFNSSFGTMKSTAFVVATANNVVGLSERNPEFFRNGRFDILINLKPPTKEGAKEIFKMYIEQNIKNNMDIFLSSVYYYSKDEMKKPNEQENSNSLLVQIYNYSQRNKDSILKFIEEHKIKNKKSFINKIKEEYKNEQYLPKTMMDELSEFKFTFDVDFVVTEVFTSYRAESPEKNRFPYVPAEIEYYVTCIYKHFLFKNITIETDNLKSYIKKIAPLQVSMSSQIELMTGVLSDFRQV